MLCDTPLVLAMTPCRQDHVILRVQVASVLG